MWLYNVNTPTHSSVVHLGDDAKKVKKHVVKLERKVEVRKRQGVKELVRKVEGTYIERAIGNKSKERHSKRISM
jgi:hypothetical protein